MYASLKLHNCGNDATFLCESDHFHLPCESALQEAVHIFEADITVRGEGYN